MTGNEFRKLRRVPPTAVDRGYRVGLEITIEGLDDAVGNRRNASSKDCRSWRWECGSSRRNRREHANGLQSENAESPRVSSFRGFYWNGAEFWQGLRAGGYAEEQSQRPEGKAGGKVAEEIKAGDVQVSQKEVVSGGNKADEFRPKSEAQADDKSLTVGEYYRDWIERRKPPFVRPGLHHDYGSAVSPLYPSEL